MTTCSSCGAENPESSRFCGSCGVALDGSPCATCGSANPVANRFCGQCGSSLGGDRPAPARRVDERKLATVLFADVVGFTSLAERSDPEQVARTVDAAFRRLAEVVAEHGGTVDKYMGDSLMAVFGVPQAHDDDAERAVAAGLAMRAVGGDLAFSIGVNTGEVMVTSLGRDDATTVVGDAVNVAARLEKTAGPGEVLVGPLTARLAGDRLVLRERQAVMLKGKREPVPVYEAVALQTVTAGTPALERPPLVGRADELAFLLSQWRRVLRTGQPAVVLVTGDAGVGTTRLVEELARELADEARVVWGSYPAYGTMGGPRLAAEVVAALGATGDYEIDSRVRSMTGHLDPALKEIDPGGLYQEQLWAFARLLEHKAAEQPLLLVVDDIHRAGDRSLSLISDLISRIDEAPILVALVGRPEPSSWLSRFPSASTVHLGPLDAGDAVALAGALVCEGQLDSSTAQFLADRSGGSPLFLRELVAIARERGQLVREGDSFTLTASQAIPPTLRTILAARLDALDADDKAALQHLAVLGEAAPLEQVQALGLPEAERVLESLADRGLLRRRGPDGRFDVADPLLAEVAYAALPHHLRAERHRQAAHGASTAEERARHLDRAVAYLPDDAALAGEASAALATAGRELLDAFRHDDAVRLLRRAVALGDDSPPTLLCLTEALSVMGRHAEVFETLDRLPADLGDATLEAKRIHFRGASMQFTDPGGSVPLLEEAARRWAEIGNVSQEAWAYANRGAALFSVSRMREAAASLEHAIPLFERDGNRGGVLAVHSFLALMRPADPRVAEWLETGLRYAEEIGDRTRQIAALVSLAWHHYFRARFGGADQIAVADLHAERLAGLAREVGANEFDCHGSALRVSLARLAGDLDRARAVLEGARHLFEEGTERQTALLSAMAYALDLVEPSTVIPVPPRVDPSPDPVLGMAVVMVCDALVLAGHSEETLQYYGFNETRASLDALEPLIPGLTLALARVLEGDASGARDLLERAVETADGLDAEPGGVAARALLAEVLVRTSGERERACQLLEEARTHAGGGIAGALVLRAATVLGEPEAGRELNDAVDRLRTPGLTLGVEVLA